MHVIVAYLMMLCASLDPGLGPLGLAHSHRSIAVFITNTTARIKQFMSSSLESVQLKRHCPHSLERLRRSDQPQHC